VTLRHLLWLLAAYVAVLAASSLLVFRVVRLDRTRAARGPSLVNVWRGGARLARSVVPSGESAEQALRDDAGLPGATRVIDEIVDSAPILPFGKFVLGASVAPAKDGISVNFQGKSAYLTPDDLLKLEAYEGNFQLGPLTVVLGIDPDKALGALAAELHVSADELLRQGTFRRFCVTRRARYPRRITEAQISEGALRDSVQNAAHYLIRNQQRDGSFRYEVNALTGGDEPGSNYPRHAGAAYFLARAANQFHDVRLFRAAELAGTYMKDHATLRCGAHACVGEGDTVDVGASALALLAYVELLTGGATEFHDSALDLAGFLRAQQRSDGDFQHLYSVKEQHPIDIQLEYYTGEAAFALSRVHRVSGDSRDIEAARHALSFLVTRSPLFLGAHYFWGAEHWTCQVLEDLWQRAPNRVALKFCLDFQASNRVLQLDSPPAPAEYDGAVTRGPFMTPRLTPLASRMEAAVATLSVARKAGVSRAETALLDAEIRRGFAFLLRYQYAPGPTYLMPDPHALFGGFPGSPIDLHVRIDYPQHAGGALLRYWESLRE
jgi:hypothetical protein